MSDKPKYVVAAPLVTLKAPDAAGALIFKHYYAGAPVPEDIDPDNLQQHLDSGQVIEVSDSLADVVAVPAGTPVPGEPPNVPVTESTPGAKSQQERLDEAKKAVESQSRKQQPSSSSSSSHSKSE